MFPDIDAYDWGVGCAKEDKLVDEYAKSGERGARRHAHDKQHKRTNKEEGVAHRSMDPGWRLLRLPIAWWRSYIPIHSGT